MGSTSREYRESIERVAEFATRIHIDFADGDFAPTKLEPIADAWWPMGLLVDFHVMYRKPLDYIEDIILQQPNLVVIHAEAEYPEKFIDEISGLGIHIGVALLKDTPTSVTYSYLDKLDHVLVFSGDLGHYGGTVDLSLLQKITELKSIKSDIEIGWDGGISVDNALALSDGGVDVLNVGGAIQRSDDPEGSYEALVRCLKDS